MLGLTDINHLTHKIENVFDAARKNELAVNGDVTELVFMGLDQLTALIDRLKEPGGEPVDCTAVVDAIRRLLQTAGVERKQSSQADADKAHVGGIAGRTTRSRARPRTASAPVPVLASMTVAAGSDRTSEADPLEDVRDEGEIPQKYLSIFIDESEASLDELTSTLLALESGGKGDDLKGLMGTAHKIKGSAASIGLNRIAKLAHLMEDLLQELLQTHGSLAGRRDRRAPEMHRCAATERGRTETRNGAIGPFRPTGARTAGGTVGSPTKEPLAERRKPRESKPRRRPVPRPPRRRPRRSPSRKANRERPMPGSGPPRRCAWTSTAWTT